MRKAARAIIIENNKILVMHRNKNGSQYYTLVGGAANEGETVEQAVVREVREETGLEVVRGRPVFYEQHPAPYNEQYIFLCEVAPHAAVAIQEATDEAELNRLGDNTHQPFWIHLKSFDRIPFRTPQLQEAIVKALKKGFPQQPVRL